MVGLESEVQKGHNKRCPECGELLYERPNSYWCLKCHSIIRKNNLEVVSYGF